MSDEMVLIELKSAPEKLRVNFPKDPRSDIQIIYQGRSYNLQKAHLRLYSEYFKKNLTSERSVLQIDADFNAQFFENILFCFYGCPRQILRIQVMEYFPIIKFLGIDSLANMLRQDMIRNTGHYNLFGLFQLSYKYNEQKIFENCLEDLENNQFSQLLEQKESLMKTSQQIFKLVLTTHNRSPNRLLNFYQIEDLITSFGDEKGLPESEVRHLKFQLIDKNKLTSEQYRDIFIKNQQPKNVKAQSCTNLPGTDDPNSPILPARFAASLDYDQYHRSLSLEMQHTWHKKISEQLWQQKRKIARQIFTLKESSVLQFKKGETIKKQFTKLRKDITHFDDEEKMLNKKFSSIDSKLKDIQNDFKDQSNRLSQIMKNAEELRGKYDRKEKGDIANSQRTKSKKGEPMTDSGMMELSGIDAIFAKKPAKNIGSSDVKPTFKKQKPPKQTTPPPKNVVSEFFGKFSDIIEFDKNPITVSNEQELKSLADILGADRFTKKRLNLVFRFFNTNQKIGSVEDIYGRGDLVFIIRTKMDKLIGGYVHSVVYQDIDEIEDERAFIFSVTHNRKFGVRASDAHEAVMMSRDHNYIICWRYDLMISEKWYQNESYCGWPQIYEENIQIDTRGSDWLAGESQFAIKEIQCYQMEASGEMMEI